MNTKVTKEIIEKYAESQGLSVTQFFRKKLKIASTNYYRMLKHETFKVSFLEKIADIIGISIDELIGRKHIPKFNTGFAKFEIKDVSDYQTILSQKDEIISNLKSCIEDKQKIIALLENTKTQFSASSR